MNFKLKKVLDSGTFQTPPVWMKDVQTVCQEQFSSSKKATLLLLEARTGHCRVSTSLTQGQQQCEHVNRLK